ncbi:MAG TPA: DUF4403 family protein [bacterium]|nr:DUF4403 family protein [bacterium]
MLLILLSLLGSGCSTLPSHYVRVVPPPIRSFPPAKPGMVRLPVVINFPQGGDAIQRIVNLLKGGVKDLAQELVLKSKMKGLWNQMQAPIFLDQELYLFIQPQTMSVGKMRVDLKGRQTYYTVLEMTANPLLVFGPKPPSLHMSMPPLAPFQPGPAGFEATSNVHMDYDDANRYLADPRIKIDGTILPDTGKRNLTIHQIRFYGSGGRVIVEVKISYNPFPFNLDAHPARLTLYLRGTPRYLPEDRVFDLPDLDYDVQSSDLLVRVASWIFKSDFKNQLRHIAKFPVGEKMDILKMKVNKALNRPFGPSMRLQTQVDSFEVADGYADNEGIEMLLSIKGTSALEVNWK